MADRGITSGRIEGGVVVSGDIVLPSDALPAVRRQRSAPQKQVAGFTWNPATIEFSFGESAVSWTDRLKVYDNDVSSVLSKIDEALEVLALQEKVAELRKTGIVRSAHVAIGTSAYPQIEA